MSDVGAAYKYGSAVAGVAARDAGRRRRETSGAIPGLVGREQILCTAFASQPYSSPRNLPAWLEVPPEPSPTS